MDPLAAAGFPAIRELLPHGGRMLLLDEVVAAAEGVVVCRVLVRHDSTFAEDGVVPGLVALEYMAQAVAAYAGLKARGAGQPVRLGYLLGSREVALPAEDFQAGDELLVEARHQFGEDAIGAFDCRVVLRGQVVASGCLNVYQGEGKVGP